ncbi:DNA replication factor C, large subunit [Pelomyxa schiedti]|nr:DNA replication factor C, large subunit [Pelomyxa schiedti]
MDIRKWLVPGGSSKPPSDRKVEIKREAAKAAPKKQSSKSKGKKEETATKPVVAVSAARKNRLVDLDDDIDDIDDDDDFDEPVVVKKKEPPPPPTVPKKKHNTSDTNSASKKTNAVTKRKVEPAESPSSEKKKKAPSFTELVPAEVIPPSPSVLQPQEESSEKLESKKPLTPTKLLSPKGPGTPPSLTDAHLQSTKPVVPVISLLDEEEEDIVSTVLKDDLDDLQAPPNYSFPDQNDKRKKRLARLTAMQASPPTHTPPVPLHSKSPRSPSKSSSVPSDDLKPCQSTTPSTPPHTPPRKHSSEVKRSKVSSGSKKKSRPVIEFTPHTKNERNVESPPKCKGKSTTYRDSPKPKGKPIWLSRSTAAINPGSKPIPEGAPNCLSGKCFLVTGVFEGLDRDDMFALIEKHGGSIAKSQAKKVTHLVVGVDAGESKVAWANETHLPVLTEDDLYQMVASLPAGKAPAGKSPTKSPTKSRSKRSITAPSTIPPQETTRPSNIQSTQGQYSLSSTPSFDHKPIDMMSALWVDKYKPHSFNEVSGNGTVIQRLLQWLQKWHRGEPVECSGVLISGPAGIGKSTAAHLALIQCGFKPVELNASDTRSKKSLHEELQEIFASHSLNEFWKTEAGQSGTQGKVGVIMDEVDGMSSGDRGGAAALIEFMHKKYIPIICICNDRQKSQIRTLANHCLDLRFQKPSELNIKERLTQISRIEGLNVQPQVLERVARAAGGDMRQAIHSLQLHVQGNQNSVIDLKDLEISPFESVPQLFQWGNPGNKGLEEKQRIYFSDTFLVPLLVQENYPNTSISPPPNTRDTTLHQLLCRSNAADVLATSDVLSRTMMTNQRFDLMNEVAFMSTVLPSYYVRGRLTTRANFPMWLGKNSTHTKNKRLIGELSSEFRSAGVSTSRSGMAQDYIPSLVQPLLSPMLKMGVDGIEPTIETLDAYHLTREDWETVVELAQLPPILSNEVKFPKQIKPKDIDVSVRTAFTRRFNAMLKERAQNVTKKKKGKGTAAGDGLLAAPNAVAEREVENEEISIPTETGLEEEGGEEDSDSASESKKMKTPPTGRNLNFTPNAAATKTKSRATAKKSPASTTTRKRAPKKTTSDLVKKPPTTKRPRKGT